MPKTTAYLKAEERTNFDLGKGHRGAPVDNNIIRGLEKLGISVMFWKAELW